jgi:tetratricopeptide (TPR) repeat protein
MSTREMSPETTLVVILGAQEWPQCPNVQKMPQAGTAARNLENYLFSSSGLGLPRDNVLNLFDSLSAPAAMIKDVSEFVRRRTAVILNELKRPAADLLIYFVGHGEKLLPEGTYSLSVQFTEAELQEFTSLSMNDLARLIRGFARTLRCYFVLDACHSGAALEAFTDQPPTREEEQAATNCFPDRGLALLCSSSAGDTSKAPEGNAYPMFTDAMLTALSQGHPERSKRLSLRDVKDLCVEWLNKRYEKAKVWPVVHSPYQFQGGELTDFPLFPNPAAQKVQAPDVVGWEVEHKKQETFEDNPYLLGSVFAGREDCLRDLAVWARTGNRVICICDLGGTGKTALVWHWFNREDTKQLLAEQGYSKLWATFYAKDYDWLKFLRHLASRLNLQVSELEGLAGLNTVEGQRSLQAAILRRLRAERWLIVLDGLEREMGAFANPGSQDEDSETQDLRNENKEVPFEERFIRSLVFGEFVRGLLDGQSKVIITSRLFPEDLRGDDRVTEYPFRPMSPKDAADVWNSVSGASKCLVEESEDAEFQISFFRAIGYHPQVIVIVASAVVESSELSGFRNWFDQFADEKAAGLDGSARKTTLRHRWMDLATRDIVSDKDKKKAWIVLCRIAARSDATNVESLVNSTVGPSSRLFASRDNLIEALRYLAKRRLLGFDEARGQVDIHPVIRTHITKYILAQLEKNRADGDADQEVLQHLADSGSVGEIYQKFLSQSKLEEALQAIDDTEPLISHFGYKYFLVKILATIYPRRGQSASPWLYTLPALRLRKDQARWLHRTGSALMASGQWDESVVLFRRAQMAYRLCGDTESAEECGRSQDWQRIYGGSLRASETRLLDAIEKSGNTSFPSSDCYWLALLLAIRHAPSARAALDSLPSDSNRWTLQTVAESWYYLEEYKSALALAAASLKRKERTATDQVLWELLTLGLARLRLGEVAEAGDNLHKAAVGGQGHYYPIITMFAYAGYIEHLYLTATNAAPIRSVLKQEKLAEALRIYSRYTQCDPRNQYQIPSSDAHLTSAMVRLQEGNRDKAIQLAKVSLQIARGFDPPFCYSTGVKRALAFLNSLGEPGPPTPSCDLIGVDEHEDRVRRLVEKWEGRSNAGA